MIESGLLDLITPLKTYFKTMDLKSDFLLVISREFELSFSSPFSQSEGYPHLFWNRLVASSPHVRNGDHTYVTRFHGMWE